MPATKQLSPLNIRDLTSLLIKHYEINEGLYDLVIEFHIGMGVFGPSPAEVSPGAMVGVSKVTLNPAQTEGPLTVNAAKVNPAKKKRAIRVK